MGRLLLSLVLGGALCALAAWQFGLISSPVDPSKPGKSALKNDAPDLGADLYPSVPLPPLPAQQALRKADAMVFPGTLTVVDKTDIPAQMPGQLMFIGEEVPEGAAQVAGSAAFLAEPFDYAEVNRGAYRVVKPYRRLYQGQTIYENQILAMVDIAKALGDLDTKRAKVIAAEADSKGAEAIAKEAEVKYLSAMQIKRKGALSDEEFRSALLTRDKMVLDAVSKFEGWKLSQIDERMSEIIYHQHEIRNKIPAKRSVIQKILKQRGDAVKELEPVMQLISLDRLMAEAQIEAEYRGRLQLGMPVTVEPSLGDFPLKIYNGHVAGAVNCLAITHDAQNPLIVSGGEDKSVLIWNRFRKDPLRELKHPDAVKALACSPLGSKRNLLVTGCADGSIRLFDLDAPPDKVLIKDAHEHPVAVTALAFSPDGNYFASGGADGSLILWSTDKVEPHYAFDEKHGVVDSHHGAISSLHFTAQCKLVSASLDNSLRVWALKEKGAVLAYEPLAGRSGSVTQLDVSSNGRWMLFDQGKTLQVRSVEDGRMVNTLQNPGGVIPFETLAVVSPDASMVLTGGASDGRLQLWRAPTATTRGFEVRQFATREREPVACAAFAPLTDYQGEGSFAVSANKQGQIYLWPLPSHADIEKQLIRDVRITQIDASLNPATRQISIGVEISNTDGRLQPGRPVTIVIE